MDASCVRNRGCAASLETRKIYPIVADPKAEARGLLRVIDDSGADCLYPRSFFVPFELQKQATRLFTHLA